MPAPHPAHRARPPAVRQSRFVVAVAATAVAVAALVAQATIAGAAPVADPDASTVSGSTVSGSTVSGSVVSGSANARYIGDTYLDLLGRAADNGGLDYHLARLAAGGDRTREAFAYALAFSAEGSRREVVLAYDDLLGRAPDAGGADYWTAHLQGRGVLDLRVLLLASDEHRNRAGGTDPAWVDALYQELLGRAADPAGRQYWLGRLQAGIPRALVAASIYRSDEALTRRVGALYADVLGRAPTPAEAAAGVAVVRATDERNLRAELVASDEAFEPYLPS